MNGRLAKKLRKIARKNDLKIAIEFKLWINRLSFRERAQVAWRALWGKL